MYVFDHIVIYANENVKSESKSDFILTPQLRAHYDEIKKTPIQTKNVTHTYVWSKLNFCVKLVFINNCLNNIYIVWPFFFLQSFNNIGKRVQKSTPIPIRLTAWLSLSNMFDPNILSLKFRQSHKKYQRNKKTEANKAEKNLKKTKR